MPVALHYRLCVWVWWNICSPFYLIFNDVIVSTKCCMHWMMEKAGTMSFIIKNNYLYLVSDFNASSLSGWPTVRQCQPRKPPSSTESVMHVSSILRLSMWSFHCRLHLDIFLWNSMSNCLWSFMNSVIWLDITEETLIQFTWIVKCEFGCVLVWSFFYELI